MENLIPKTEIRTTLEEILSSRGFSRSPILTRFLRFVVENTLAGDSHKIKEYTVGIHVLDKSRDFKPQEDASVRIHANRLRRMLSEYYQENKDRARFRIELPKGSYVPVFSPCSMEYENGNGSKSSQSEIGDVICIFPFTVFFSSRASKDFSVIGFCEFLNEKLSQFHDIKVMSFHSVLQFSNKGGEKEDLRAELGVSYYLTGSVEVELEMLQIHFQLYDAQKNIVIWSQHTNSSLVSANSMDAADIICNQVVSSLAGYSGFIHYRKVLNNSQIPPLTNKMANAIFWFYNYIVSQNIELFEAAIKHLEKAVQDEENCGLCYAVLAHLYTDSIMYNYKTDRKPLETAVAYLDKAFALDPNCQHAHLSRAWTFVVMGRREEAFSFIEKTYELNPNSASFLALCSIGMSFLGHYEKSLFYLKKAKQLNPLPFWWMYLPELFFALKNHDFERVLFFARKSSPPTVIYEHVFEMIALYYLGDHLNLSQVLLPYKTKYPDGLVFVEKALATILADNELVSIISKALLEIDKKGNGNQPPSGWLIAVQ